MLNLVRDPNWFSHVKAHFVIGKKSAVPVSFDGYGKRCTKIIISYSHYFVM